MKTITIDSTLLRQEPDAGVKPEIRAALRARRAQLRSVDGRLLPCGVEALVAERREEPAWKLAEEAASIARCSKRGFV